MARVYADQGDCIVVEVTWWRGGAFGGPWPFEGNVTPDVYRYQYASGEIVTQSIWRSEWEKIRYLCDPEDVNPPGDE